MYDREGNGRSDPPSARRRTIDDLVSDLHGLLATAHVPAPYVLVGSSGGGLVDVQYAKVHPDQVAGPRPARLRCSEPTPGPRVPQRRRAGATPSTSTGSTPSAGSANLRMPIGDFPVLIVQADPGGDDKTTDQSYWLGLSPRATLTVMPRSATTSTRRSPAPSPLPVLTSVAAG